MSGADGSIARPFPNITGALAFSAAQGPTQADPVVLYLSPGTWTEPAPIELVSNVYLLGRPPQSTTIASVMSWTAGVGVNANQLGVPEQLVLAGITYTGAPGSLEFDTSAKPPAATALLALYDFVTSRPTIFTLRATSVEPEVEISGLSIFTGEIQLEDGPMVAFNAQFLGGMRTFANSVLFCDSCILDGGVFGFGFSVWVWENVRLESSAVMFITTFTSLEAHGSSLAGSIELSNNGVLADIRSSYYVQANLVPSVVGNINRSLWATTVISNTTSPSTIVPLTPPYLTADYVVTMTQRAGTPTPVVVTSQTTAAFSFFDPTIAGGNTFDVLLSQV